VIRKVISAINASFFLRNLSRRYWMKSRLIKSKLQLQKIRIKVVDLNQWLKKGSMEFKKEDGLKV
jgi:hypothetical protein